MSFDRHMLALTAITDRRLGDPLTRAEHLIAGGITALMLREKDLDTDALATIAAPLARRCRQAGVAFLVNGSLEVGATCGADGVHLGREAISLRAARAGTARRLLLGTSVHTLTELEAALDGGADYVIAAPIFMPGSKKHHREPLGIAGLKRLVEAATCPVLALGGIRVDRVRPCLEAGAVGVAAISALYGAADPRHAAHRFRIECSQKLW